MSAGKQVDQLESWMLGLKDLAASRGYATRLAYADRVAGDALVLTLDEKERDQVVELLATRRPRGRAHLAVMATTATGAALVRDRLSRAHAEISRLANARRKFVHRFVRLVEELATTWAERAKDHPEAPLTRLQSVLPEAIAATGVGHHVELAGGDDLHRTKEKYPTLRGAAVLVDGRWHILPYDARRGGYAPRPAAHAALLDARPGLEPSKAGIAVEPEVAGLTEPGALVIAGLAGAAAASEVHAAATGKKASSWTDCVDPCSVADVCDLGASLGDLGNCVPDCDLDFDCGSLDCSW